MRYACYIKCIANGILNVSNKQIPLYMSNAVMHSLHVLTSTKDDALLKCKQKTVIPGQLNFRN